MDAKAVAEFLLHNPKFFDQHPDVFADMRVPHPHGEAAISLVERQMLTLRDKNRQIENKMAELIQFGGENDEIGDKMHRVAISLMRAHTSDAVIDAVMLSLRENFGLPAVALRLWGETATIGRDEFLPVSAELRDYVGALTEPYCGPHAAFEVPVLLATDATLASYAVIPLPAGRVSGVLLLGSHDARRFFPEMGTLYLNRLSEMIGAALSRFA